MAVATVIGRMKLCMLLRRFLDGALSVSSQLPLDLEGVLLRTFHRPGCYVLRRGLRSMPGGRNDLKYGAAPTSG